LPLAYHHSHFLAATLDFTSFFTMAFLGPHTFLQLGCFGLDHLEWYLLVNTKHHQIRTKQQEIYNS